MPDTKNPKPKKQLGQNFLNSGPAIGKIVDAGEVDQKDVVVEIGPGKGALTQEILSRGAKVIAIEADSDLIPFLTEKFSKEIGGGQLIIVHGDVLQITDSQLKDICPSSYKLIANIPYYITGAIIEKFLSSKYQPSCAVLLVQKEVAERITRKDIHGGSAGAGSILSESVWVYGYPKYIHTVKAGSFFPTPKVDSAILSISGISRNNFSNNSDLEEFFFTVLKAGFSHKRKMLISNLAEGKIANKHNLQKTFTKLSLDEKIRAEKLTTNDWLMLAKELFN